MDRTELINVLDRINGYDEDNSPKVTMSYQCYVADDGCDAEKEPIHPLLKGALRLTCNPQAPEWFTLDISYHSYQEPELKLFWGYLRMFRDNQNRYPDKDSIFFLNAIENKSIDNETLLSVSIVNPVMFFLTADAPNAEGLNIVRMLVHSSCLNITEEKNEYLFDEIAAAQREAEEERYINAGEQSTRFDEEVL